MLNKGKYKALMLDIDGTIIPYRYNALPSKKVADAIRKASKKIPITLVTGRSFLAIENILNALKLTAGYAVINNGANVVDIKSKDILYDQPISKSDAKEIIDLLEKEGVQVFVKQKVYMNSQPQPYQKGDKIEKPYMFFAYEEYSSEKIDSIFKKLSHLSDVSLYKIHHGIPEQYGINITHAKATKLHGVEVVIKKLGISKEEVIGVGDGYNDFPLLMASGLKIAMENAIDDLKAVADYIAPSVDDDGLAHVIEKFVLGK